MKMKIFLKKILKIFFSYIHPDIIERVLSHSILSFKFKQLKDVRIFTKREELWDFILKEIGYETCISYIEFGVYRGYSIKYISNRNKNDESIFLGCDSFEGLPEDWYIFPKGHFDTKGIIPKIDDNHVRFIKGFFQNTFNDLRNEIINRSNFLVHFDADLYSSTLFLLTRLDEYLDKYYAIFDEFTGHESRALYNYQQSYGAKVIFLGKVLGTHNAPSKVLCQITTDQTEFMSLN